MWEGDLQNDVKRGASGTTYASNCEGHMSVNVFEYATKYGLVDEKCQKYAHVGDPLTHFDADAGANECILTNHGATDVVPLVEIPNPPSISYVKLINGIRDAVFGGHALTPAQATELKRILCSIYPSTCQYGDDQIVDVFRQSNNRMFAEQQLAKPPDELLPVKLSHAISPGESV